MANLLSQGSSIWRQSLASESPASTYEEIGQVMSISGPDGSASEIDVSNLASTAKEFVIGLPDNGSVQLEVSFDYQDSTLQHDTLLTARTAQTLDNYQIRLSDSPMTSLSFAAYVTQFSISLGVDDKVSATFGLRISGGVTFA